MSRALRDHLPARLCVAVTALALLVPTGGVSSAATAPEAGRGEAGSGPRVLAISVDGLRPAALKKLGRDGAPNFYRLLDEGASTLNARTSLELTLTLPNHTGMVTGRRVKKKRKGHGVTWNDDRAGTTVQKAAGHGVASIFTRVHGSGGSTALFATKSKFSLFNRSWPRGIDRFKVSYNQSGLVRAARRDLVNQTRAFTFLHTSLPDVTGHASGFTSDEYLDAVARTDRLLGKVLGTIDDSPALTRDLVVILTSDHGGTGSSHSDRRRRANYQVPFVVWGPGVAAANLYDLSPTYANPRRSRPDYRGKQPIRNGDLANLAADLLGLAAVPGSLFNKDQQLRIR